MELNEFENDLKKELDQNSSILKTMSTNCWIDYSRKKPIPRQLFGELWFEKEFCILFSDTNLGKSILAVQISNSISKGISTANLVNQCEPQKVLYLDFELSAKQFENRYSENYQNHYVFDENFLRSELDLEKIKNDNSDFENELLLSLENEIVRNNPKVVIVDNITYLKNETEKAKDALRLMKILNSIKKKLDISILVLAHTPKRDDSRPITINDASGSKNIMNFCDSSFAIGRSSSDTELRYIKQIKERNVSKVYGTENILIYRIVKINSFLSFDFVEYGIENEHLSQKSKSDVEERNKNIIELHKNGINNCEIARQLNVSEGTVRYILNQKI